MSTVLLKHWRIGWPTPGSMFTLAFFRSHGHKRTEYLLHLRPLTSWTPDICGGVFMEAHGYHKLAIACLAVIFITGHGVSSPHRSWLPVIGRAVLYAAQL